VTDDLADRSGPDADRPVLFLLAATYYRIVALQTSSAWWLRRSSRSAWPGRPAPPRCGSGQGRPLQLAVRQAVCQHPPARRPLRQARPRTALWPAGDEKPFKIARRLVHHRRAHPGREHLLVTEFFGGAVELGEAEVDEQVIDDGLGIIRKLWRPAWPTATSSRPTCWSARVGCC
jgi:hypothetical protein